MPLTMNASASASSPFLNAWRKESRLLPMKRGSTPFRRSVASASAGVTATTLAGSAGSPALLPNLPEIEAPLVADEGSKLPIGERIEDRHAAAVDLHVGEHESDPVRVVDIPIVVHEAQRLD